MSEKKAVDIIKSQIETCLRGNIKDAKYKEMIHDENTLSMIDDFIHETNIELLFITINGDKFDVSYDIPKVIKKKVLYFIKTDNIIDSLTVDDMNNKVIIGELTGNHLDNLHLIAQEVYFPLLSNTNNREGWSGPTAKDVMLKMNQFLSNLTMTVGQSKGKTLLPHPPEEALAENALPEKERIYLLESVVIKWTNRIQQVLDTDPIENVDNNSDADAIEEMKFWKEKGIDLDNIHKQLQNPIIKDVLAVLTEYRSQLASRFQVLTSNIIKSRSAAQENYKFLNTLTKYLNKLHDCLDFSTIDENFLPIFHTILLISKHSNTYNNQKRLGCLIRELINSLITQANDYINGKKIFQFIEDEDINGALRLLRESKSKCQKFIKIFTIYKSKAIKANLNAWDLNEQDIFKRIDIYLERIADVSEFTNMVQQFLKLEKIFLGGTRGSQLTSTLRLIFQDFRNAVEAFQETNYDLLDIHAAEFDSDFYKYRSEIKGLERRLSTLLTNSFDDASTLHARFKLLDSFEGLLERPIIKDELDKKQSELLKAYTKDFDRVRSIFHEYKDSPRIDKNLPPVAGKLTWCRSLLKRIQEPMAKLKSFLFDNNNDDEKTKEAENNNEAQDIETLYQALVKQLKDYELKNINQWNNEVEATAQDNLHKPLLRKSLDEDGKLYVNFDEALVRLLREVKYLLGLDINISSNALKIYEQADIYRQQTANLDYLVFMYNEIALTLNKVEKPLVLADIQVLDGILLEGINQLNWTDTKVDQFISNATKHVQKVYNVVTIMKQNFNTIKKLITDYSKNPLVDRKNKTVSAADYAEYLNKIQEIRHEQIRDIQKQSTSLLKDTNKALKGIDPTSITWRAYTEFVEGEICEGLAQTIVNSINFIIKQLDPANITKNKLSPLLEIKLGLYANDVLFNARNDNVNHNFSIGTKSAKENRRNIWEIVNGWVEDFFEIGEIMHKVDDTTYTDDLKKHNKILRSMSILKNQLENNQKECEKIREQYLKYDELWKLDRDMEFESFLEEVLKKKEEAKNKAEEEEEEYEDENKDDEDDDDDEEEEKDIDNVELHLGMFENKILYYKDLERKINEKTIYINQLVKD